MKIMFAVGAYWPSQDGVTHITEYLAEGLAQRGHEVLVLTSAGNGGLQKLPEAESHEGVRIERMRIYVQWPLHLKGRDPGSTKEKYVQRVCAFAPDILIIVCAQTWTLDWILPRLDKITCPKVFYSHGYSRWKEHYAIGEKLKKRNFLGALEEWLCKRYYQKLPEHLQKFDLLLYLSELNNSCIYGQLHHLTKGKILENALEDAFLEPSMEHRPKQAEGRGLQYLYVANYNDNKNQDMLLRAFCEADIRNCRLVFAGFEENEYLMKLREHAGEWLVAERENEVEFCVHLSREEIYDLYRSSDVFVSASRSENCPIVHREAAAGGMAVISTDVGDVRQLEGILLVNSGQEMQKALEHLYEDRTELAERGRRLRAYVHSRKCRIKDKVDWLEGELQKLLSDPQLKES